MKISSTLPSRSAGRVRFHSLRRRVSNLRLHFQTSADEYELKDSLSDHIRSSFRSHASTSLHFSVSLETIGRSSFDDQRKRWWSHRTWSWDYHLPFALFQKLASSTWNGVLLFIRGKHKSGNRQISFLIRMTRVSISLGFS